jgi:lipoprotein-releasing system permease protein
VNLEFELALKFLRRRSGVLLRGTALAAFAGVALATAALVITLALMGGYSNAIASALQTGNAHLVGFSPTPLSMARASELSDRLRGVKGVRRATPVSYLSGLLDDPQEPTNPIAITVKAIATPPPYSGLDGWPDEDLIPAVLGSRLADSLGAEPGTTATLRLPPEGKSWIFPALRLQVVGSFQLAFSEFDESWILVPLDRTLAALPNSGVGGVELIIEDPMAVHQMREDLERTEPSLLFTDWRDMNRSLFAALRWQTLSLFVVLTLVVAVSSFQVSSALVVLAIDKRRSAGMLQALGATPARIRRVMLYSGVLLGGTGVAGGLALGCVASWVMTAFKLVRFPPGLARVYMVDVIPLQPQLPHLAAVVAVCLALVVIASLWPAWRTSREDPVAALRAV